MTAWAFLRGQLRFMKDRGFDVTLISALAGAGSNQRSKKSVRGRLRLPMLQESQQAFRDGIALTRLRALPAADSCSPQNRPLRHAESLFAGRFGGAPRRRSGTRRLRCTGMRTDGLAGRKQSLMLQLERLSCRSAQRIYCVSESLRSRAVELRLAPESKLRVLGHGTANGIDVERFSRTESLLQRSQAATEQPAAIPAREHRSSASWGDSFATREWGNSSPLLANSNATSP